jgi:hypothetical protein
LLRFIEIFYSALYRQSSRHETVIEGQSLDLFVNGRVCMSFNIAGNGWQLKEVAD